MGQLLCAPFKHQTQATGEANGNVASGNSQRCVMATIRTGAGRTNLMGYGF
jgi:hypothetical protein